MKYPELLIGLTMVACELAASAQTYQLALNGTISQASNAYANPGDSFSATFTLRNPVLQIDTPTDYDYQVTGSFPGDDTFQDLTTTGEIATSPDNAASVAILSDFVGFGHPPTAIYGYQFDSGETAPATYDPTYQFWEMTINLESTDSAVAPTGGLSDIQVFPAGEFNYVNSFNLVLEQATYSGTNFTGFQAVAQEAGTITSYNVTATAGPEPSTWALFSLGTLAAGTAIRTRRSSAAAVV